MAATYKQLFTHRHTIRYRLERVKELTGLDVNSTDGRERLGLGLKAMRVLGVRAPSAPVFEPGAESGRVPKPPRGLTAVEAATTRQDTPPLEGVSSFAKSLFLGEIHDDLVFPYPKPDDAEQQGSER